MLRFIGCALLAAAGTAGGWYLGEKPAARYRLICALTELVKEVSVMLGAYMPTSQIFESLCSGGGYDELSFLRRELLTSSDRQALISAVGELEIEDEIKDRLARFLLQLGSSEMQQERTRAELLYTYLKAEQERTALTFRSKRKLCRTLGILSGAFAAVMLI